MSCNLRWDRNCNALDCEESGCGPAVRGGLADLNYRLHQKYLSEII
jgi:hypothetical protein